MSGVDPASLPVRVQRSARRTKSVTARVEDDHVLVQAPARMRGRELDESVAHLVAQLQQRHERARRKATDVALAERAARLSKEYGLPRAATVQWSTRQQKRWGSCSLHSREIRVSAVLMDAPDFVVDNVLLHELAHLVEPNHSPAFHALADQHPLSERAKGYLLGKGLQGDDPWVDGTD